MFESAEPLESLEAPDELDLIESVMESVLAKDLCFGNSRDGIARVEAVARICRRATAMAVQTLRELDRSGVYGDDGHASAKVMARHVAKLSNGEAAGLEKQARMSAQLPEVAEALAAGELGVAQFELLGRVYANPRVRLLMVDAQGWFIECAQTMSYSDFETAVREWERLADMDGSAQGNQRNHERRNAKMSQDSFDLSWELRGDYGALQGATMDDIFGHYISAERLADWQKARAQHGDAATEIHLDRTEAQRRADAMWQIFQDAASADSSAVPPDFCHDIVWDSETFEAMVAAIDPDDPATLDDADLDPDDYRCETIDGVPLEPLEAASTTLVAKMRRVVVNAVGVVIDLGRARRFTGSARKAVQLSARRCRWPGCGVPTSQCEIDHTVDYAKGGSTNPENGGPYCGRHNRFKQKGFTVWRDPTGQWHTYRPDGTEIL